MTDADKAVIDEMFKAKARGRMPKAFCVAAKPLVLQKWNQRRPGEPEYTEVPIPAGTPLKIVMVSRFGDVGLTDDLDAVNGYHIRVFPSDDQIKDLRLIKGGVG